MGATQLGAAARRGLEDRAGFAGAGGRVVGELLRLQVVMLDLFGDEGRPRFYRGAPGARESACGPVRQ